MAGTNSRRIAGRAKRERAFGLLLVALLCLALSGRGAGEPAAPAGYRLVYNVHGDHRFHLLPLPAAFVPGYTPEKPTRFVLLPDTAFSQVTINGTSNPLLLVDDSGTGNTGAYLAQIEGNISGDTNIPLEVYSQVGGGGGATLASLPTGQGGIDIVQNTAATTSPTMNYSSPFLRFCAQEVVGSGPAPNSQCWKVQVLAGSGANAPDVIEWTRDQNNTNNNITMRWPKAINLASRGQITVGPEPVDTQDVSTVPSTFTGEGTMFTSMTLNAKAGPITVEPGQLLESTPAGSFEGPLQILQGYLGSNGGSGNPNVGLLACPSGTPQSVVPCGTTGAAENWIGVYNDIPNQNGIPSTNASPSVTPLRYGRVKIQNEGTSAQWTNGHFICKDDANASYVVDNGGTPG